MSALEREESGPTGGRAAQTGLPLRGRATVGGSLWRAVDKVEEIELVGLAREIRAAFTIKRGILSYCYSY